MLAPTRLEFILLIRPVFRSNKFFLRPTFEIERVESSDFSSKKISDIRIIRINDFSVG